MALHPIGEHKRPGTGLSARVLRGRLNGNATRGQDQGALVVRLPCAEQIARDVGGLRSIRELDLTLLSAALQMAPITVSASQCLETLWIGDGTHRSARARPTLAAAGPVSPVSDSALCLSITQCDIGCAPRSPVPLPREPEMTSRPRNVTSRRKTLQTPARKTAKGSALPREDRRASIRTRYTLIHLSLPQEVVKAVDTLLWLRVTAAGLDVEAIRGGKHRIYDEAVAFFLSEYERRPCEMLKRVSAHGWRTVRVQTALIERCQRMAERANVAIGSVVSLALLLFVQSCVQPAWFDFRNEVRARAAEMLNIKEK